MKILYYFQELDTPMFQWQRQHFIDELKRHNILFETFNPLECRTPDEANEKIVEIARKNKYDLFMSNVTYHKMLYVDTLKKIKSIGIPTFTISWDNLMAPHLDEKLAPHFDLVMITAKETEYLYKKWRVNYFFAPYAANPFLYKYNEVQNLSRNACFIGTPHGSRAMMINQLTSKGIPVNLYYGKGSKTNNSHGEKQTIQIKYDIINPSFQETIINRFRFKEGRKLIAGSIVNRMKGQTMLNNNDCLHRYPGLSFEDMVQTYSDTVLSLSSSSAGHTDVLKHPLNIINLRNFEIPMCGGIQLCKYNAELAGYFEEDKEIVFYRNEEELVDKARYYLEKASDLDIFKMKAAARMRAENEHTWWNRFTTAFDVLGLKH